MPWGVNTNNENRMANEIGHGKVRNPSKVRMLFDAVMHMLFTKYL